MKTSPPALGTSAMRVSQLLPLLDPALVKAVPDQAIWKTLDEKVVFWLTHTAAKFPWLNQMALVCAVFNQGGAVDTQGLATSLNSFLRWAIPEHYPDVASLKPTEAMVAYFGDPPQRRGDTACSAYSSFQLHMQRYLASLPVAERALFAPFLFPLLAITRRLSQLKVYTTRVGQAKRKEQAFAVARDLQALLATGRWRYKWLAELDAQVQQTKKLVEQGQIELPALIQCPDLDRRQTLTFRVWNQLSWVKAHPQAYGENARRTAQRRPGELFLQLVGALPDTLWFLRAVQVGALGRGTRNADAQKYLRDCNLPELRMASNGLIAPPKGTGWKLAQARKKAAGTPEDSRVLFCVESLLAAASIGLFTLVCLTQSGMRIGELQQVSGDKECMKIGYFPQFDDQRGSFSQLSTRLLFWQLYPKGMAERQSYPVTPYMQEALKVWMEIHERFCGRFKTIPPVRARESFSHARQFSGSHLFVLQWKGKHLSRPEIEMCLDFLLLEHRVLDSTGKPTRITSHILRHGIASYLRQQGVPLEDIATLLHQVNVIVTDYYSKPSPQELFAKLGPLMTRLGDLAEVDPSTLRTVGDIRRLGQEALKRFGILRRTPGGMCATFAACEVQFRCASCPAYIPNPAQREEVLEKIASCSRTAQFLEQSGDPLQADVQRAQGRNWERIEKEMAALAAVELAFLPFESALKAFGLDNLDEVDAEWLLTLKQPTQLLPSGRSDSHA